MILLECSRRNCHFIGDKMENRKRKVENGWHFSATVDLYGKLYVSSKDIL